MISAAKLCEASAHAYASGAAPPPAGLDFVGSFHNLSTGASGKVYLSVSESKRAAAIVVAFCGTNDARDVATDLDVRQACTERDGADQPEAWLCRRGWCFQGHVKVHRGFARQYESVRNDVLRLVADAHAELDDAESVASGGSRQQWPAGAVTVHLTGHSLGGALALLSGHTEDWTKIMAGHADDGRGRAARMLPAKAAVTTFGAPRVGNEAFATAANTTLTVTRYEMDDDPVPHLSTRLRYAHAGKRVPLGYDHSELLTIARAISRAFVPAWVSSRCPAFLRRWFFGSGDDFAPLTWTAWALKTAAGFAPKTIRRAFVGVPRHHPHSCAAYVKRVSDTL